MDIIVGSDGFLGRNIKDKFQNSLCLKKDGIYKNNLKIYEDLESCLNNEKINTIFNCAVSYNENNIEELNYVNFLLPKKIIKIAEKFNIKIIFFGSFSEKFKTNYRANYVSSKNKFSNYLKELNNKNIYILYLEHIYGKYDRLNKFIPYIVNQIKENKKIILDGPYNIRDFTPV